MRYKLRHPAHILAGLIIAGSSVYSGALPLTLLLAFLAYEVMQWLKLRDDAYLDIFEMAIAAFTGSAIIIVWRLVT